MIPTGTWGPMQVWLDQFVDRLLIYPIPKSAFWRTAWVAARSWSVPDELFVIGLLLGKTNTFLRRDASKADEPHVFIGLGYEQRTRKWLCVRSRYEYLMLTRT